MKNKSNLCTKIGLIFTIVSILASFTIFIPMFTVFPAEIFFQFIGTSFETISYESAGFLTMILFSFIFILTIIFTFNNLKIIAEINQKPEKLIVTLIMILYFFIVHNLGYILLLAFNGFPIDALNTLASMISFPISSIFFVVLGYLMDKQWNKYNN